ncbi:hypothetical protein [Pseudomonas khorasanensis]|nr:hypothetical protein [Pseudomonas khorasanensis]
MPDNEAQANEELAAETEPDPPLCEDDQRLQPPLIVWRSLLLEP